jgi:hypothetical protein
MARDSAMAPPTPAGVAQGDGRGLYRLEPVQLKLEAFWRVMPRLMGLKRRRQPDGSTDKRHAARRVQCAHPGASAARTNNN